MLSVICLNIIIMTTVERSGVQDMAGYPDCTPDGPLATVTPIHPPDPQEGFSFSADALEAQQLALAALEIPHVEVVRRKPIGEPERYNGSTIFKESVRFNDGAVRLATHVVPDNPVTEALTVSADPWGAGDKGFNDGEIRQMADHKLPTAWLHHQGRHRIFPPTRDRLWTVAKLATSKGVARSAAQELALVQDISGTTEANTQMLVRRGYSRSGMSGNAFIVQAEQQGAEVVFSHLEAECFPHALGTVALVKAFLNQAPGEGLTLSSVGAELLRKSRSPDDLNPCKIMEYAQTLDLHPLNLLNELLWIKEFKTGEAGTYAQAVRLDAKGIRLHYEADEWAQISHWLHINQPRPGITTLEMPGAHTAGAGRRMRTMKGSTFRRIANYAMEHEGRLDGITVDDVLDPQYRKYIVSA